MNQKWLYMFVLLMVSAIGLYAQENVERVDTSALKPKPVPVTTPPLLLNNTDPFFPVLSMDKPESKEERAARINLETYQRVMTSVKQFLYPYRPPHLSNSQKAILFVGGLYLTSPYKFRPGTVPVMNASNPFMYAVTPGMAPFEHTYSTDAFPQYIKTELDFSTGTYKQVMVKWDEFEKNAARSFGGPYRLEPVPKYHYNNYMDYIIP